MDAKKIFFSEPRSEPVVGLARMARQLGITQAWLKGEAEAGRVPCLWAGGRFLFSPEAVKAVLARRAAGGSGGGRG